MPAEILTSDRFPKDGASLVFARMLNRHSPAEIAAAVEILIDVLDMIGGNPDAEVTDAEDDFAALQGDGMPGCPIADPGAQVTEDEISAYRVHGLGPGCPISDPGESEEDGI